MNKVEQIKAIREQIRDKYPTSSQPILNPLMTFTNLLPEEPVSEELEEASEKYACMFKYSKCEHDKIKVIFKDGAKWQKEQMMKDAIPARVSFGQVVMQEKPISTSVAKDGDKVKVIIVKEEE